ncbi:MAG: HEPN domain-containing protein [Deltaproteobacteria bacterium]|nr:HEPN domain-containing protein [Deltaproteobacteria bacterium]
MPHDDGGAQGTDRVPDRAGGECRRRLGALGPWRLQESLSRSYYVLFYAVLALLATKELGTSKHSAAISLFDREFMRTGDLPRDLSSWIHEAFRKRLEADYAVRPHIVPEQTETVLNEAKAFLAAVKEYLARTVPSSS